MSAPGVWLFGGVFDASGSSPPASTWTGQRLVAREDPVDRDALLLDRHARPQHHAIGQRIAARDAVKEHHRTSQGAARVREALGIVSAGADASNRRRRRGALALRRASPRRFGVRPRG